MTLETRKVIGMDALISEANLSGKEIEAFYSDLSLDNYVVGKPFEILIDITKDNQEDYEKHWQKILNMLVEKHQCVYEETIMVV